MTAKLEKKLRSGELRRARIRDWNISFVAVVGQKGEQKVSEVRLGAAFQPLLFRPRDEDKVRVLAIIVDGRRQGLLGVKKNKAGLYAIEHFDACPWGGVIAIEVEFMKRCVWGAEMFGKLALL